MKSSLRRRFWPESGLGVITAILFLVTLVRRDWIEAVFGVDPDQHSGSLEWLIVGALLVATVTLFAFARYEWRRAATITV
ncbi:MAG: ABC transporter permease [Ktedonobacterales bacterium]